ARRARLHRLARHEGSGRCRDEVRQDHDARREGLFSLRSIQARGLQGSGDELPHLGSSNAPAHRAWRRHPRSRLDVTAGRLPARNQPHRHARLRQTRDQMQIPNRRSRQMTRLTVPATAAAVALLFATPALAETIFVSNEKDNTITVVDGKSLEVVKTIKVARRPRGIVLSPDNTELFVAAGDGDIMDVIDTKKLEVSRQLDSGPDPELMAVDPAGKVIYIANEDDSLVTIMDIKSGD